MHDKRVFCKSNLSQSKKQRSISNRVRIFDNCATKWNNKIFSFLIINKLRILQKINKDIHTKLHSFNRKLSDIKPSLNRFNIIEHISLSNISRKLVRTYLCDDKSQDLTSSYLKFWFWKEMDFNVDLIATSKLSKPTIFFKIIYFIFLRSFSL